MISGFNKIILAKPHKYVCRQQEELNTLNLWIHDRNSQDVSHLIDLLTIDTLNCSDTFFYKTPLQIAIIKEDLHIIEKILARGIDLNVKNSHGLDAYNYAVRVGNVHIMAMLYKNDNESQSCYFCSIL